MNDDDIHEFKFNNLLEIQVLEINNIFFLLVLSFFHLFIMYHLLHVILPIETTAFHLLQSWCTIYWVPNFLIIVFIYYIFIYYYLENNSLRIWLFKKMFYVKYLHILGLVFPLGVTNIKYENFSVIIC